MKKKVLQASDAALQKKHRVLSHLRRTMKNAVG
jgi:hypothetical protein